MTENISTSNETDNTGILVKNNELFCPICNDLFIYPRSYSCGHTLCEICMIKMDKIDKEESNTHTVSKHNCPLCRKTTIKPWHRRPINITIQSIVNKHKDYTIRKKEADDYKKNIIIKDINREIDLSKLSYDIRNLLAEEVYETILPLLYEAAQEGLNYISIDEKNIIKDIEKTVDILSKLLFKYNNIYKILVTRKECLIYFTKNSWRYKREHINNSYQGPEEEEDGEIISDNNSDILIRRLAETYVRALSPINRRPLPPPVLPPNLHPSV